MDNKPNVNNNCINGKCSKCTECCGIGIPLTKEEAETIKEYIKKYNIEPTKYYDKKTNTLIAKCCFLNNHTHRCKIYDVRPEICKLFKCDNSQEQIIKNREECHKKAYYNHSDNGIIVSNMMTFNELFYDDPGLFIALLTSYIPKDLDAETQLNRLKLFLTNVGRKDLADELAIVNGETLTLKKFVEWKDNNENNKDN